MKKFASLCLTTVFVLSIFSTLIVGVMAQTESWPMSQKDLANTGYLAGTGPKTNHVLWNFTAGGWVWSDVAVVDKLVYVGCVDQKVYALDSATGKEVWEFETGGRIVSSPSVADGVVYIGSDDRNVYALDAKTDVLLWNYTTGGEVQSSPKISGGVVFVGSRDNNLYALDASTGNLIWKFTTGDEACFLAGLCQDIGFSQYLQQIPCLERLNRGCQIDVRAEDEHIKKASQGEVA